jgi:hypothetical protein
MVSGNDLTNIGFTEGEALGLALVEQIFIR